MVKKSQESPDLPHRPVSGPSDPPLSGTPQGGRRLARSPGRLQEPSVILVSPVARSQEPSVGLVDLKKEGYPPPRLSGSGEEG